MHCDEVIRELAVPTDDRDSAALAEHLANCPSCAVWAKRDAQFDRLWDATRPMEPSPQVWDTVWSHIASSLDSATPAEFKAFDRFCRAPEWIGVTAETCRSDWPRLPRARSWNWAAIGLIGLAQAAAVLLAVGLAWRISTRSRAPQVAVTIQSPDCHSVHR